MKAQCPRCREFSVESRIEIQGGPFCVLCGWPGSSPPMDRPRLSFFRLSDYREHEPEPEPVMTLAERIEVRFGNLEIEVEAVKN
jgi:hypothetical protein